MKQTKTIKHWPGLIKPVLLLLTIAVLLLGLIWNPGNHSGIAFFGYKPYVISSASMEPTFRVNALVVIKSGDFRDAQIGDVIAFRSPALNGKLAFHRVIAISDKGLIVKGDNNQTADSLPVTQKDYVGKGVFHTNATAAIATKLKTTEGFFLLIVVPMAAVVLLFVGIRILKQKRKTPKKTKNLP